jgi:hypothetical protein
MMVFVHYADEHPLYTYAFYSPLTKRILFRQDCIFLPSVFPMRAARQAAGLAPDGESLVPYRSPPSMRGTSDLSYSFLDWSVVDPLPNFEDHVSGIKLTRPLSGDVMVPPPRGSDDEEAIGKFPYHPAFGETSVVRVRVPPRLRGDESVDVPLSDAGPDSELPAESEPNAVVDISDSNLQGPHLASLDETMGSGDPDPQPPLPDPIHPAAMTSREGRHEFVVNIEFPISTRRPVLRYRVYSGMSVRLFYHLVASRILGCEAYHICMYVNDYELQHLGSITDRFYPDFPEVSTPYLSSECVVRVEFVANVSGEDPITDHGMGIEATTSIESIDTEDLPQTSALRRVSSRLRSQAQSKNAPAHRDIRSN